MLAVAALWTCGFDIRRKWPWLILGALIPIGVQAVVDWGTMGLPLQSIWRYFWINIMEQRAAAYGVMPAYWYLGRLLVIWGPILPFLLVAAILGTRRAPLLAAMVVAHVAAHTLIGHKEERLLFPALPLLIILAGLGICEVMSRTGIFRRAPGRAAAITLLCLAALSVFGGARDGFAGNWSKMSGGLYATDFLRERQDLCGIGLLHGPGWLGYWFPGGGYYRLHRPVPFFIGEDAGELARFAPGFNYASLPQPIGDQLPGYERLRCWPGEMNSSRTADAPPWCVYRRTGACAADAPGQINDRLRELGE